MAHRIMVLLMALGLCLACGSEDGSSGDGDDTALASLRQGATAARVTAGSRGLQLMLPIPADEAMVLTRAYGVETHQRHGAGEWDDSHALDLASNGCGSSWGMPVVAAASGLVAAYPLPGSSALRDNLNASYGESQVFIDHGNGCFTHYGHLDRNVVRAGQRVQQGELIGYVGNKGHVESACAQSTPHWGSHLHFKVVCDGTAVLPEPLSGYVGLNGSVGRWLEHGALHHPAGTLVKSATSPDIFLVADDGRLRRVRNEQVWRSYRFFQDASKEWDTVVTVSADELACHNRGLDLDAPAQIEATTCLSGASFLPYVTYDDGVTRWRKRVPFAVGSPEYVLLLKSWGFRPADVIVNGRSCALPDGGVLPLRDGTVIEAADDNDFYVVSNGGTAYRLYRNLMPVLYGSGWPQVIQVPSGSVPSLVARMDPSRREFTVTEATTCLNGSRRLEPAFGDGTGGGETDGDGIGPGSSVPPAPGPAPAPAPVPIPVGCPADSCVVGEKHCHDSMTPVVCVPSPRGCGYYAVEVCTSGYACDDVTASCLPVSSGPGPVPTPTSTPQPTPAPAPSTDGPRTLRCTAQSDGRLRVTVTGPVLDTLVARPSQPSALQYGSDTDGWGVPYASTGGKPSASWSGDGASYTLMFTAQVNNFNLYVVDAADAQRESWFDLVDANGDGRRWNVVGDCRISGTKIVRGAGTVPAPAPTPAPTPQPAPTPAPQPAPTTQEPMLTCTATQNGLQITVSGLETYALIDGDTLSTQDIAAIGASGDGGLSWTPSAVSQPRTACNPAFASCALQLPAQTARFNLWAWSVDVRAYWFDLEAWSAQGDCVIADDGLGGLVLLRD